MIAESFRRCFWKLPEATLLISPDGRIEGANEAATVLLQEAGAFIGVELRNLVLDPESKVERLLELFSRSRDLLPGALLFKNGTETGLACRVEGALWGFTPDDRSLLVRLFSKDEATRRFHALNERIETLHREISERVRAEARLYAQQEWLRTTLASIGDAVIATDVNGNVSFLNEVAQALTGWDQNEAAGLPLEQVFVIDDKETGLPVENPVSKVLREGRVVELANHTRLTSKDGARRPIDDSAAPIRDAEGKISGVVLVFRDISARKDALEALRNSERTYRAIGESIRYGVWVCDAGGRNTYASDSFLQLVGLTQEQYSNSGWDTVLHPEEAERTLAAWKDCVRTGANWDMEQRFRGLDSQYHWIHARGLPVRDSGGKILFWAGMNLDIGQAKAAEQTLRAANQALVRANADLQQFAFAASHDLQEPLRVITSYSQLLIKNYPAPLSEEAALCVKFVTESTGRMRELLADLLAYTQLNEDGGSAQDLIDLNVVFRQTEANLAGAIHDCQALVTCDPLPSVRGREPHFLQLFQNLIANALKYRSEQPPRIHVSAAFTGGLWRLSVTDNGIGIAPEYHRKIFGVFRRLHGKTIPGTGIGLAICQRVVERYDGRIWVESQLHHGAAFHCTLPTAVAPDS